MRNTKETNKDTYKDDLKEIKLTLAIMQKEIEKLEKKLLTIKPELNSEDVKELWEMTRNRSK